MKTYRLAAGDGLTGLRRIDITPAALGDRDVRIEMRAAALNFRDLAFARGQYDVPPGHEVAPLSDGVGTVVEIGSAVTRFAVGDRVIATFWPNWIDGDISPLKSSSSFGAHIDGTLTELGTGSVSIWALQLAAASGLHAIVTSSSDEKLAGAEGLGARGLINYRVNPEWQTEVSKLTDNRGVDLVLDVGGQETLTRSLSATRLGGRVVVIGGLSGWGEVKLSPGVFVGGAKTLAGIMVGSRAMTEDLVRFVDEANIVPVIDSEFSFLEAQQAYERLASGSAFGKVAIRIKGS